MFTYSMPAVGHARGKALAATHLAVLKLRRTKHLPFIHGSHGMQERVRQVHVLVAAACSLLGASSDRCAAGASASYAHEKKGL